VIEAMTQTTVTKEKRKSRRAFLTGALYGIPSLIGGTLTLAVANYLFGRQATQKDSWVDAGDISELPRGTPCQLRFERAVADGWKIRNQEASAWIVLNDQRKVTAFSPLCTHLGCAYRWQGEKNLFTCPCHGSEFNVQGDVTAGPASRPLDRYATKLEDNRLWLGPLRTVQDT
jgi:menaquinol-cytochrome c reductase iron-sulfur subunit